MQRTVVGFLDDNHAWLVRLLNAGRAEASLEFAGTAEDAAHMILGALEGAMLVARPYGDTTRFQAVAARLIAEFDGAGAPPRRRRGSARVRTE
jgi:hypothetical protein